MTTELSASPNAEWRLAEAYGEFTAQRPTASFILTWIVVPNLPFLYLWIYGGPPRYMAIGLFYGLGIFTSGRPLVVKTIGYLAVASFDLLVITSNVFNLTLGRIVESLSYYEALSLSESGEYVLLAGLVLGCAVVALLMAAVDREREFNFYAVTGAALLLALVDASVQHTYQYSFGKHMRVGAAFDSAAERSGFAFAASQPDGRNILVVVVESWPLHHDEEDRTALSMPLLSEEVRSRYDVSVGATPYYGSTTSAEIREFCGRWDDYDAYLERTGDECLPQLLGAKHGYESVALHGFSQIFFERERWYPNIGFDRSLFFEQLVGPSSTLCGHVFTGVCDLEVAEKVAAEVANADGRRLIYWLTLNSHLPIHPDTPQNHYDCAKTPYPFGSKKLCRNANIVTDVMTAVGDIATTPREGQDPIILVVGDHSPPYWTRAERERYSSREVPWILLDPLDRASGEAGQTPRRSTTGVGRADTSNTSPG